MSNVDTHGFADVLAKDLEAYGHAYVALNRAGEPARSRTSTVRVAAVVNVESLSGYRTRLTLETGRTMTMPNSRWMLAEHHITEVNTTRESETNGSLFESVQVLPRRHG